MTNNSSSTNTFSLFRFGRLFYIDLRENLGSNILFGSIIYALLSSIMLLCSNIDSFVRSSQISFGISFCLFTLLSTIYISSFGNRLESKSKRIRVMMTPGLLIEKFLVRFVQGFIVFPLFFILIFLLSDLTRYGFNSINGVSRLFSWASVATILEPWDIYTEGKFSLHVFNSALGFMFYQSLFFLASFIWYRFTFLKTILCLWLSSIIWSILFFMIFIFVGLNLFFKEHFFGVIKALVEYGYLSWASEVNLLNCSIVFYIVMILFNLTISYFRFKETQMVNGI